MKRISIVLIFTLFRSFLFSQTIFYSLETQYDARSISMGESFVALANATSGANYNPATLVHIKGISASFNKRYMNWNPYLNDYYFLSMNASINTSIGVFGVFYNRLEMGKLTISTPEYPMGVGKADVYEHTFGLSFATTIYKGLKSGITVKTCDEVQDIELIPGYELPPYEITQPYLLDFGLIYDHNGLISSNDIIDRFSWGASIQNIGTDFKINDQYYRLPKYLRIGFAYNLTVDNQNKYNLKPFIYTLSAEYCNHLNPSKYEKSEKDYWKTGMEVSFFEILSLRIGGYTQPYRNIYGSKGLPSFRYGLGLNVPLRLIGCDSPASLSFDYAAIPLEGPYYWYYTETSHHTLSAFSIALRYEKALF